MKTRRACGWLVALAAALSLGACSSGGGGGGDDGGNGGGRGVTVVPNQFSAEPEQEVELAVTSTGVTNPEYSFAVVPPASLLGRQDNAEEIARRFGAVDAEGVFVAGAEAEEGARGSVVVTETRTKAKATVPVVIVRPIREVLIEPAETSLLAGQTVTFEATATDFNGDEVSGVLVDWRAAGDVGTIDATGAFRGTAAGAGTVTARVGLAPAATAEVTVVGTITGLRILPQGNPVSVEAGTVRQFRAVVADQAGNQTEVSATWQVEPAAVGTITTAGLFTAGSTVGATGTLRAVAQGQTATLPLSVVALITPPGEPPGNVTGRVLNGAGEPVAGATVSAVTGTDGPTVDEVASDGDGRFGFFLPVGTFTLEANGAGGSARRTVTLAAQDQRISVELRLAPG